MSCVIYYMVLKMWGGFFCGEVSAITLEVLKERLSNMYQILQFFVCLFVFVFNFLAVQHVGS